MHLIAYHVTLVGMVREEAPQASAQATVPSGGTPRRPLLRGLRHLTAFPVMRVGLGLVVVVHVNVQVAVLEDATPLAQIWLVLDHLTALLVLLAGLAKYQGARMQMTASNVRSVPTMTLKVVMTLLFA